MSLAASRTRIHDAASSLRIAWEQTGESWRDEHHRNLGERVIAPFQQTVRNAESSIERMTETLTRIQRECS